jgi:hypothetical protein
MCIRDIWLVDISPLVQRQARVTSNRLTPSILRKQRFQFATSYTQLLKYEPFLRKRSALRPIIEQMFCIREEDSASSTC